MNVASIKTRCHPHNTVTLKMFKIAAYFTCYASIFPVSYDDSLRIDLSQASSTFYFTALRVLSHNASACFKESKWLIFV